MDSERLPMGPCYGPSLILVGSVLWATVWYVVHQLHNLYVRISRFGAHLQGPLAWIAEEMRRNFKTQKRNEHFQETKHTWKCLVLVSFMFLLVAAP